MFVGTLLLHLLATFTSNREMAQSSLSQFGGSVVLVPIYLILFAPATNISWKTTV